MKIKEIHAREILDSRGYPTIATEIELLSGEKGYAEVPSGSSTGKTEVVELRDGDKGRYNGKGVLKAVNVVNTEIRDLLLEKEFTSQREFDQLLIDADGTPLKSNLGGNSILSCSMAFARAISNAFGLNLYEYLGMTYWEDSYSEENFKLPTPLLLMIEGAKHGNWSTDIQEYMIVPNMEKFDSFPEVLRIGTEIFHHIHDILDEKGYSVGVGFEGAYAPKELSGNDEPFEIITEAVKRSGYSIGDDFTFALDLASSEFYDEKKDRYVLKSEGKELSRDEWIALQREWYSEYPTLVIEDHLHEDDWEGWSSFLKEFGKERMIVGDDLLTTNTGRIRKGIEEGAINSVLIKLNQIGTVTETLDAIRLSKENGLETIVSHRGGETNDSFISDLVVATPSNYCKFGAPSRGERVIKYNRLLEIGERVS